MTRERLRNAASTLAHYWAQPAEDVMNRLGVERVILAYPEPVQRALCVTIAQMLRARCASPAPADAFEEMLFDAAVCQ